MKAKYSAVFGYSRYTANVVITAKSTDKSTTLAALSNSAVHAQYERNSVVHHLLITIISNMSKICSHLNTNNTSSYSCQNYAMKASIKFC